MARRPKRRESAEKTQVRMVDVGSKRITRRRACAGGEARMAPETLQAIRTGALAKGNVLAAARIAGIQAAKRCSELIPLCHPIALDMVQVDFLFVDDRTLAVEAEARARARTGVEMEALTAVSVALLVVYDMCKSLDRGVTLGGIRLLEKSGGRSGRFRADRPSRTSPEATRVPGPGPSG